MRRALAVVVLSLAATGFAGAQRQETVVRVRVLDTLGEPVGGADVAILRGMTDVIGNGTTDAAGGRRFVVPRGGDELQVVVRRIGFQRGDHFFRADKDSLGLMIRLRTTPHELAAVQVTTAQTLKQKRYHVTADDIAASRRPIINALDVVTKMRPDMMDPPGQGIFTRCGLYYVWVNGRRIRFAPFDPGLAIKASQTRRVMRNAPHIGVTGLAAVPLNVQSVLASIHPEHIEAMTYIDCQDTVVSKTRAQGAVYVALKQGVGFEVGKGSYVADAATLDAADIAEPIAADEPALAKAFRNRLLGVFDETTGDPIAGAQIIDVATGTFALTTATGTVGLGFLPEGVSAVQIRRAGYADLKVDVTISPRDTVPLTLMITPKPK